MQSKRLRFIISNVMTKIWKKKNLTFEAFMSVKYVLKMLIYSQTRDVSEKSSPKESQMNYHNIFTKSRVRPFKLVELKRIFFRFVYIETFKRTWRKKKQIKCHNENFCYLNIKIVWGENINIHFVHKIWKSFELAWTLMLNKRQLSESIFYLLKPTNIHHTLDMAHWAG